MIYDPDMRRMIAARLSWVTLIGLAALVVLGCGPTLDQPRQDVAGVIAPAVSRPDDLDSFLLLPDDVEEIAFPWSQVEVERAAGRLIVGVLVADTPERRSRGMMYRSGLPPQSGMIFIWEQTRARSGGFWNPNVPIDLDVAWLDRDGVILEFTILIALDSETKYPQQEYFFVLEMPRGRFAELGIGVGDRVLIPSTLLTE